MSIIVKNLNKSFGENKVLNNFSCEFKQEEITCIMGASGCGKTTLLQILLGLLNADNGEFSGISDRRISVVFQENRLCSNISSSANIRLVNQAVTKNDAAKMLKSVGLADAAAKPARELSGGMKRRVAILRALAADYEIIILDEPFKGLDDDTKEETMNYFKAQTIGKTVIMVTHDKDETEFFGANVINM